MELRPGGRLVVLTMALTVAGEFGYRPVLEALYGALLALVADRFLSAEELHGMAIPTVGRSLADLEAPFAGKAFAGLEIDHAQVFDGADPIWEDFARDGDAAAYGARWAAFSRASVLPTLARALAPSSDTTRAAAFVDRVERAMAARLAAAPEKFPIPLASVVLRRTASSNSRKSGHGFPSGIAGEQRLRWSTDPKKRGSAPAPADDGVL